MDLPINNPQLSPMMRQYLEVKQKHMDKLLMVEGLLVESCKT